MYTNWSADFAVVGVTVVALALCVLVHYEGLQGISHRLHAIKAMQRGKVVLGVFGIIALHVIETWIFGIAIWVLLDGVAGAGSVSGAARLGLLDAVYLSAATFSTVGFGDLAPAGPIRFLSGTEALTGFILITWSASFLYLEMEEFWSVRARRRPTHRHYDDGGTQE